MEDKNQKQEERIQKQFSFSVEIDKEKEIGRQTYLASGSRKEDDAEHAWHMAIMAYLFREHANEKIDILRTIMMILTHDLVEVYAGDTYAYDEEGKKSQKQRELAAADKLYPILPEDQAAEMRALWDEFEAGQTPEAKFAHAMDNLQP
ncbi:MAG TPA: hydrolase, partial [Ruminococcus sp.]|nr:hydrolase [Ruminococcus sp.]